MSRKSSETLPNSARVFQLGLQITHVIVGIAIAFGLAQPHAVNDRSVVQTVRDDRIFRPQKRLKQSAIGIETCRKQDRVIFAQKRGQPGFQTAV